MSRQTFNSYLKDSPGYWCPFVFLTEMKEQKVVSSTNLIVPTYITLVFHDGETKFFRISRKLADFLWQVKAIRAPSPSSPFFSYEVRGEELPYFKLLGLFKGVNIEALRVEANAMLETIPDVAPKLESVMDTNGREIEPEIPAVPKFGRKILY